MSDLDGLDIVLDHLRDLAVSNSVPVEDDPGRHLPVNFIIQTSCRDWVPPWSNSWRTPGSQRHPLIKKFNISSRRSSHDILYLRFWMTAHLVQDITDTVILLGPAMPEVGSLQMFYFNDFDVPVIVVIGGQLCWSICLSLYLYDILAPCDRFFPCMKATLMPHTIFENSPLELIRHLFGPSLLFIKYFSTNYC